MKRPPSRFTTTPKRGKIPRTKKQKSVSAYCWIVYSITKSWYKSNKLKVNVYSVYRRPKRMLRYSDARVATPLNWTMTAWSRWTTSTTKQNGIYQFFWKRFNQRRLQFLFAYSFSNRLAVSCFSFWKAFVKCLSLSVKGIFDNVRYNVNKTFMY